MIGGDQELKTLIRQNDHLSILRHLRTHKLREPKLVIHHASSLLGYNSKNETFPTVVTTLSESERLAALEQLLLAALDVSNISLAEKCILCIRDTKGVPRSSTRVKRLIGQSLESTGVDSEEALEIYNELLDENPANAIAFKRKYTLLAAVPGKELEARDMLNSYVQYQQGDSGAWMELYFSCMDLGDYKGAAFALEEVVLSSPLDAHVHCLLGEVYATIGGSVHMYKLARKHLSLSLELKSYERGNLRALYSLTSVSDIIVEEYGTSHSSSNNSKGSMKKNQKELDLEHDVDIAKELIRFGGEKIIAFYRSEGKGSNMEKIVKDAVATYRKV